MDERTADEQLSAAAILAEPVRRALYLHVAGQPHDVGRDGAAKAVGIDRALAAFHLDKLVAAGLLDVSYRRLTGRTGPGAGRPSKLYRRSAREIDVSVPDRRYAFLARLLARAIEGENAGTRSLDRAARELGMSLGAAARADAPGRPRREHALRDAGHLLERMGFQPYTDEDGVVRLRNCPFDAVAREHRPLVCGANVELIGGVLEGLGVNGVQAALEPKPGMCCVALRRVRAAAAPARTKVSVTNW